MGMSDTVSWVSDQQSFKLLVNFDQQDNFKFFVEILTHPLYLSS